MEPDQGLRERLVLVGAELLRTEGPSALSLREIARRAGVSHGAPRRYFLTHLDLLAAIAGLGFADLGDRITTALDATPADPRDRVAVVARVYARFAADEPGMFELMFRQDLLESGNLGLRDTGLPVFRLLVDLVSAARPDADQPAVVTAGALWAGLHGVVQLWNWGRLPFATGLTDSGPLVDAVITAHLGAAR
ncbi:TetR family transcriptional regulator [Actinoplanes sp. OR16]|uniref:TetR/AcrR family transcriptional regulator n=1 Tax=Actinoplanes sp. OR16 TaxID=946334 RepID=UPI000F6FEA55|nr:TetR/AcrR family transcriptional regulator [Actinoplanes sp. OR16]BBH63530.1 TetR family transcriptional regulator [Actinoplanes sp. OR16]